MKTPKMLVCLGALVFCLSANGQANIEFEEFQLDNGLHVILHEDHSTPIVAVSVLYHVGSKNEKEGRTGFAHFFEHLMFEGSPNIDRGEYMKIVQSNGGSLNANTTFDRTFYYQVLPSNQLELGLWLESERMLHATVDEKGVETQREVVKEEKRLNYDNRPYGTLLSETFARTFANSYYQHTPIGTLEDLNAAKIEDFADFYETYYVPQNATLSIAGDINPEEAKKLIADYFGEIPSGSKPINRPSEKPAPIAGEVIDTVYDNIQLPAVILAYQTPEEGTADAYAMEMLSALLSGGQSSRMYKKLVDEDQKALAVQAFPYALENAGIFGTFGIVNSGVSPEELLAGIDAQIESLINDPITEKEYTKVLNQIESSFISRNATVQGIAESLANYHVYYGDANLINTEIEQYRKVTIDDLKRVAQKYLKKDQRVVLFFLPENSQS